MKTAKLFMNGKSQAVRLPKEFRMDGEEVYIKQVGNVVQLIPMSGSWETFWDSLDKFSPDFMADRQQPQLESREDF